MSRVGGASGETSGPQRLGLIALGLALAFLLLEVGLRVAGWAWLRDRDRRNAEALASGGTVRVLCLGESTTALGGETAYPRQLEGILNASGGRRFSVVNGGVPGTTTDRVLAHVESLLDEYRPHVIVTMLGVNDGLAASGGFRRLPVASSLRVVKLVSLLVQHLRAKVGATDDTPAAPHDPIVARALAAIGARRYAEAATILREAASAPDPPADVVRTFVVASIWSGHLGEVDAVLGRWLAVHPEDDAMRTLGWQANLARAAAAMNAGRLDEAGSRLRRLDHEVPPTAPQWHALVLAARATHAELRGDHVGATRYRREAASVRAATVSPTTERNYRAIVSVARERGIRVIAMQYPLRSVEELRAVLGDPSGVELVDNERPFRDALRRSPWSTWFTDTFAGDFGHTTPAGSQLLAANAARAILGDAVVRSASAGGR